jgi:hypothetical protein
LESLSHGIDAVKAIAVTLGGIATAVLGWFGILLSRQRKRGNTASARKPIDTHPIELLNLVPLRSFWGSFAALSFQYGNAAFLDRKGDDDPAAMLAS